MTWPAATKNAMLTGITFTHSSLHSTFPGAIGSAEISGGAYARQAITMNAASGGQRLLNAAVAFSVPACTVGWVGFWNSTTFVGCAPNGGATPKNFVALASTDTVYLPAHGYANTQKVVLFNGTPPSPLFEGTVYYVRGATTDTFELAATAGGALLDLTSAASFGCVVCAITEEVYGAPGTHNLNTASIAVPD